MWKSVLRYRAVLHAGSANDPFQPFALPESGRSTTRFTGAQPPIGAGHLAGLSSIATARPRHSPR